MLLIQVLNRKLNHLNISEFTAKLYAPFKSKEEDMKNAAKTAMLLVKLVFLLLKKLVKCKYSFAFIINVSGKSLKLQETVLHLKMETFKTFLNSFPSTHYRGQSFSYLYKKILLIRIISCVLLSMLNI